MFRESTNLAAAYGIAVTGTMFITTCMLAVLAAKVWKWPNGWLVVLPDGGVPHAIDGAYFASNLTKVPDGGWFPLLIGAIAFTLLTTWAKGRELMMARLREAALPIKVFIASAANSATRVPGTAVFMTSTPEGVPHALLHNLKHNKVHPRTRDPVDGQNHGHSLCRRRYTRCRLEDLGEGFHRLVIKYGFMQEPDVPAALGAAHRMRPGVQDDGHELFPCPPDTSRRRRGPGMAIWREHLFSLDVAKRRKCDGIFPASDKSGWWSWGARSRFKAGANVRPGCRCSSLHQGGKAPLRSSAEIASRAGFNVPAASRSGMHGKVRRLARLTLYRLEFECMHRFVDQCRVRRQPGHARHRARSIQCAINPPSPARACSNWTRQLSAARHPPHAPCPITT